MNTQPLLSVIIPLYNCGRFVIQCLDSIYAQQLAESEFEVIVVDDGSTDNGAALVAQYARGHGNLQLLRQENQGVACARNHALCKACGDYVTFVDADDLLVSGSLKPLLQVAVEHDAEVVKAAHVEIAEETTDHDCKEVVCEDFVRRMSGGDAIVHVTRFKEGYCWGYLIRRSLVADHAITFPDKVSFMEDWAFITRVLLKCRTFVHRHPVLSLSQKCRLLRGQHDCGKTAAGMQGRGHSGHNCRRCHRTGEKKTDGKCVCERQYHAVVHHPLHPHLPPAQGDCRSIAPTVGPGGPWQHSA